MIESIRVYFAGDLFTHKDLIGNEILSLYIEKRSHGRYVCILPQNLEQATPIALQIRNQDLSRVVECDVALFNFDGADVESGTVAEFIYAKSLDTPSVILRTDFRSAGNDLRDGDRWNLMLSGYPRTRVVYRHAMMAYQEAYRRASESGRNEDLLHGVIEHLYSALADDVIEALDDLLREPFPVEEATLRERIRWALTFPGGGLEARAKDDVVDEILSRKLRFLERVRTMGKE